MTAVVAEGGVAVPEADELDGTEGGDPRYRLVYEEALGSVDRQERTLDELRARVGATLATAVIASAFFGTIGIKNGHLGGWQKTAIVLFVVTAVFHVILLLPQGHWRFRRSPKLLIRDYIESDNPATLEEMYRDLALHIDADVKGNEGRLTWMWNLFTAAVVVLVAEVVVWLLAIAHP